MERNLLQEVSQEKKSLNTIDFLGKKSCYMLNLDKNIQSHRITQESLSAIKSIELNAMILFYRFIELILSQKIIVIYAKNR